MEQQKKSQVENHEREHYRTGQPRQADNRNPLIASLNAYRLRKMVEMIGTPLRGKSVLSVCGFRSRMIQAIHRDGEWRVQGPQSVAHGMRAI